MFSIIILFVCVFTPLSYANPPPSPSCQQPEIPFDTDPQFGDDCITIFAYDGWANLKNMKSTFHKVKRIGLAKLTNHYIEWVPYFPNNNGPGLIPVAGTDGFLSEIWGTFYTTPTSDKQLLFYELMHTPDYPTCFVKENVEIQQKDGEFKTAIAYVIELKNPPPKIPYGQHRPKDRIPRKSELEWFIARFKEGGLPEDYIDKISQTPTTP